MNKKKEKKVDCNTPTGIMVDRDMIWKLGKLQSAYNELRFDVETVLTVHKSFVFRLLILKQHS